MRRIGKRTLEWQRVRREWLKDNPPNFQGFYECYLCHKWIPRDEMTLDHIIARSNAKNYANRHDFSNLKPACYRCNTKKGSKTLDKYISDNV